MKLPLLPNGAALKLAKADGVLGGKIWPAAVALCQYLVSIQQHQQQPRECVELGSGTGAVGIYAAALGFPSVTLTEHRPPLASVIPSVAYAVDGSPDEELEDHQKKSDRLLQLLQSNVEKNAALFDDYDRPQRPPKILELDWTNPNHVSKAKAASSKTKQHGYDLILASDVTYISQLHQPLADTIAGLLLYDQDDAKSKCLISHQHRLYNLKGWDSQLTEFEKSLTRAGLTIVDQTSHPVTDDIDKKIHQVSILDIQHHSTARQHRPSELWTP